MRIHSGKMLMLVSAIVVVASVTAQGPLNGGDPNCDGVNDIGEPSSGGRKITVAATFENSVHILRPKGMPGLTVEREIVDGDLIWRYGPKFVLRLERVEE